ncbi:hypothetical protein JQ634_09810 [Bradyrhizobium sp. AUGA SZCCT0240]|nr:hypothetical protein [Bradyrhizobium sp. AUGA SZCCT0240]MBR1253998.1 hypothetical protein [Bradyrhizobium sp. AUGA SZCCT0240]
MAGYKAPFYNENISKVGLLRVSLAADIIRVYNGVFEDRKVAWEKPAPNSVVSIAYATGAVVAYKFQSDLQHVAMRIRAFEEDTPDPGSIYETQDKRHSSLPKLEEMVPAKLY